MIEEAEVGGREGWGIGRRANGKEGQREKRKGMRERDKQWGM